MTSKIFVENFDASPELYAKIIDALPIPIFCKQPDGIIKACNLAFARIVSKDKKDIIGRKTNEIIPYSQSDVLSIKDHEIIASGIDQFYETKIKYSDGNIRNVIINKAAVKDNNNIITGIVSSIIDITERKKAQNKLIQAEEDKKIAETMLQKIRAGIVIVNHDLRIIDSNMSFARMFGQENEELFETIPGLRGAELDMLVPEVVVDMFKSIIETGESRIEREIKLLNKWLSFNVITIHKNKVVGAIIRDMSAPMLERAEIIERARQVNRKNMKTVQQIAFLLGENAAQTEELLNSIIESQKYDIDENQ